MRETHMATHLYKKTEELSDLSEGRHEPVGGRHHPQVLAQSEVGECASEAKKKKNSNPFFIFRSISAVLNLCDQPSPKVLRTFKKSSYYYLYTQNRFYYFTNTVCFTDLDICS